MSAPQNWNATGWMRHHSRSSGSARRLPPSKRTTCSVNIYRVPSTASWSFSVCRAPLQPQPGPRQALHWTRLSPASWRDTCEVICPDKTSTQIQKHLSEEGALDFLSVSRTQRDFVSGLHFKGTDCFWKKREEEGKIKRHYKEMHTRQQHYL